jgi:CAAX protease family protein
MGAGAAWTVWACIVAATSVAALLLRHAGRIGPRQGPATLLALAALALAYAPVVALAAESIVQRLRRRLDGHPIASIVLAGAFLIPYCLYWVIPGKARPERLLAMAAYIGAASLLALLPRTGRRRFLGDALVVLAIWLPVELRWLQGCFPWPAGGAGHLLAGPIGLGLLLYLMLVVRRLDGVGYTLWPRAADLRAAVPAFAAFAVIGIPFGLWTGFLAPRGESPGLLAAGGAAVTVFLFTALPEETLFRGFIQTLLERSAGGRWVALGLASLVFGVAHIDNGPVPDWRYVVLATLAGIAYGWSYLRTGRVLTAALTHLLVDWTWVIFLKR